VLWQALVDCNKALLHCNKSLVHCSEALVHCNTALECPLCSTAHSFPFLYHVFFLLLFSPFFPVVGQARAVDLKLGDGWGVAAGGGAKSEAARARDSTNESQADGIYKKKVELICLHI
jgi:hypothetical protein